MGASLIQQCNIANVQYPYNGVIDVRFGNPIGPVNGRLPEDAIVLIWSQIWDNDLTEIKPLNSLGLIGAFRSGYTGDMYLHRDEQVNNQPGARNLRINAMVIEPRSLPDGCQGFKMYFGPYPPPEVHIHASTWWGLVLPPNGYKQVFSRASNFDGGPSTTAYITETHPVVAPSAYLANINAVAWINDDQRSYDGGKTWVNAPILQNPGGYPVAALGPGQQQYSGANPDHNLQINADIVPAASNNTYTWKVGNYPRDSVTMCLSIKDPPPPPTFNYHGWEMLSLSPSILGGPAVTVWKPGHLHFFARKSDNNLYWGEFKNNVWYGWTNLGGPIASDPQVVSMADGWLDVFAVNTAGNTMHRRFFNGHWEAWENLGGTARVGPDQVVGCASMAFGRIDIFCISPDTQIWTRTYRMQNPGADRYPTGWGPWVLWPGATGFATGLVATGSPYPASAGNSLWNNDVGQMEIAGTATNGNIWHRSFNSNGLNGTRPYIPGTFTPTPPGWQPWENLSGVGIGRPSIASLNRAHTANAFDMYVRGTDNRLWHNHFQTYQQYGNPLPALWSGWLCAGGPISGSGIKSSPGSAYGYTFQTDAVGTGYYYPTWDSFAIDNSGYPRRVAYYGDPTLSAF